MPTDDPLAHSPLDSPPQPGESTPDLNDAACTATDRDSSCNDFRVGHTDNYEDPGNSETGSRYPEVAHPWRFRYGCLAFNVLSMLGESVGPATSDGDLTGDVAFPPTTAPQPRTCSTPGTSTTAAAARTRRARWCASGSPGPARTW